MALSSFKINKNIFFYSICILLWIFSFPVAAAGENISPPWLNAVCVCSYFLFFLRSIDKKSPGRAFKIAFALAFIAYYFILNWIKISMHYHAGMPMWQAQLALIMAASIVAIYPALAALVYSYCSFYMQTQRQKAMCGVVCFSAMELARQITPFGGFPWVMPAYGLHALESLIQVSSVIGALGLSLLLYCAQFLAYYAWTQKTLRPLSILALFITLLWGFGSIQIRTFYSDPSRNNLRMAWVQGNIPQDLKWTATGKEMAMDIYTSISQTLVMQNPDLIVWPEAAVTSVYKQSLKRNRFDAGYLKNTLLLFGAPSYQLKNNRRYYQNSVFAVNKDNALLARADKYHLVPFGEYVPFPFSFLERWIPAVAGSFIKGSEHRLIKVMPNTTFGTLICYESLFPYLSRNAVARGADIIINVTNDAWFNKSSGPYQHKIFAKYRAIETRRSLVRAANTGISTWFDATGKQHGYLGLFERGHLIADIPIYTSRSLFVRFPYAVHAAIFLASLLLLLNVIKARKRKA